MKNECFLVFLGSKLGVLGLKWLNFPCKNRLFRIVLGVFGAKSVPTVPYVSLVPWYSSGGCYLACGVPKQVRHGCGLIC